MSKDDPEKTKQGTRSRWKVKFGIPGVVHVEYERETFKGKTYRAKKKKTSKKN